MSTANHSGTVVQEAVITTVNAALSDGQPFTAYDVQDLLDMEVAPTSIVRVLRQWTNSDIRNRRIRKMLGGRKLYIVGNEPGSTRRQFAIKPPRIKTDAPLDTKVLANYEAIERMADKVLATPKVSIVPAPLPSTPFEILSEQDGAYLLRFKGQVYAAKRLEW